MREACSYNSLIKYKISPLNHSVRSSYFSASQPYHLQERKAVTKYPKIKSIVLKRLVTSSFSTVNLILN